MNNVVSLRAAEPRPPLSPLMAFAYARQAMLRAWTELAQSGHPVSDLDTEMVATLGAMRGIAALTHFHGE